MCATTHHQTAIAPLLSAAAFFSGSCTMPYTKIQRVFAAKAPVLVSLRQADIVIWSADGSDRRQLPEHYHGLAKVVADSFAEAWPNEKVTTEINLEEVSERGKAAPLGEVSGPTLHLRISGDHGRKDRALTLYATIEVREKPGAKRIGRAWSVGQIQLQKVENYDAAFNRAFIELERAVRSGVVAWVGEVKAAEK